VDSPQWTSDTQAKNDKVAILDIKNEETSFCDGIL
jgi:hypothetical protein